MKKFLSVSLVIIAGFLLICSSPVSSKTITLRFTDQNSELGWGPVHALQPWVKKVEDAAAKSAKDKLKIRIYPSQTLSKGKDNWNAVKTGIADMGWCFHGYWPGMTPLADVISLPALPFKTAVKGSETLWKLYEKFPEIRKQFDDNHILLLYTSDPYSLITTKKQVKRLEDLQGLKIRMTGGPPTDQMKALGGIPMSIPMPDNYIALKQGVIDGMGAPWEAIHSWRLYEVVNYYTETPFPAVYFSIAVNKRKWNKLPQDIKDAITSVSGLEGARFWGKSFDMARQGVYDIAQKAGYTINYYSLTEEERARWLEIGGKPIWKEWVKKMESQGHPKAQEILDTMLEMLKLNN
jgi:TRAP-type C4-dicarboxylate transport system substrate-binding protein